MKTEELKLELIKNNINQNACLINPIICPEGALCLNKISEDEWKVIMNERGELTINEKFYSEHDACRFFLLKVLSDPTYRNDFRPEYLIEFKKTKSDLLKKYGYEYDKKN